MRVIAVDWSGKRKRAEQFIRLAEARDGRLVRIEGGRNRDQLIEQLIEEAHRDPDLVIGLDFAFSLPAWYVRDGLGLNDARELWSYMDEKADAVLESCPRPFWGRPGTVKPDLSEEQVYRRTELDVLRQTGVRPKSVFQLAGGGQVATGSLRGMRGLARLDRAGLAVWPFGMVRRPVVVEIYPRLLVRERIVKKSPTERATYLSKLSGLGGLEEEAAESEDAFDAAVSALEMSARVEELGALPPEPEPDYRLEGRIWHDVESGEEPPGEVEEPGRPQVIQP